VSGHTENPLLKHGGTSSPDEAALKRDAGGLMRAASSGVAIAKASGDGVAADDADADDAADGDDRYMVKKSMTLSHVLSNSPDGI
jgi:hypothetical protein